MMVLYGENAFKDTVFIYFFILFFAAIPQVATGQNLKQGSVAPSYPGLWYILCLRDNELLFCPELTLPPCQ